MLRSRRLLRAEPTPGAGPFRGGRPHETRFQKVNNRLQVRAMRLPNAPSRAHSAWDVLTKVDSTTPTLPPQTHRRSRNSPLTTIRNLLSALFIICGCGLINRLDRHVLDLSKGTCICGSESLGTSSSSFFSSSSAQAQTSHQLCTGSLRSGVDRGALHGRRPDGYI